VICEDESLLVQHGRQNCRDSGVEIYQEGIVVRIMRLNGRVHCLEVIKLSRNGAFRL
jgi:hypothetical protein